MKLLALILLPILTNAQVGRFKMDMVVSRVDMVSNTKIPTRTERITLIYYPDSVRIETLEEKIIARRPKPKQLTKNQREVYAHRYDVFITKDHQLYHIVFIIGRDGFVLFVTPLFPFTRKPIYALNMKSI